MENPERGPDIFKRDDEIKEDFGLSRIERFALDIKKPRSEWSDDFNDFVSEEVEKRRREKRFHEKTELLRERIDEETKKPREEWSEEIKKLEQEGEELFQEKEKIKEIERYLNDLDITSEELMKKKVLDIGCGPSAGFVIECIEELKTKDVFGIDLRIKDELLEKYPEKLHKSDFYKELPEGEFDLMIARASLIADTPDEEMMFIGKMIPHLKSGGELKIYPFFENSPENIEPEEVEYEKERNDKLKNLSKEIGFTYYFKPIEINVYDDEHPCLKLLLVIKRN